MVTRYTIDAGDIILVSIAHTQASASALVTRESIVSIVEMLTTIIIVARVQPGTSKGITDLLLP